MTAGLKTNIKVTTASLLFIALTIGLWRSLYGYGTLSAVSLIPLTILIVTGSYHTSLGRRQAGLDSILTESTRLRKILKGRILSAIQALIIAAGGILLIAYKGIVFEQWEIMVATSAVISTAILFSILVRIIDLHVNEKYLLTAASNITVVFAGTAFFLIYMYALWDVKEHPSYLINESLASAINAAMNELPQGEGITAEIVELGVAIETLKLWAVVNSAKLIAVMPIIYMLYGAVFGYFQVKVITSVVCAVSLIVNMEKYEGNVDE